MESHSEKDSNQQVCWFCKKGRHSECMIEIPIDQKSKEPDDCTFNTKMILCECSH